MISKKIVNVVDTLEATFDAGLLDNTNFSIAMSALRDLARQAGEMERQVVPDQLDCSNLPGVPYLPPLRAEQETRKFLDRIGVQVAPLPRVEGPSDTDPGGAA